MKKIILMALVVMTALNVEARRKGKGAKTPSFETYQKSEAQQPLPEEFIVQPILIAPEFTGAEYNNLPECPMNAITSESGSYYYAGDIMTYCQNVMPLPIDMIPTGLGHGDDPYEPIFQLQRCRPDSITRTLGNNQLVSYNIVDGSLISCQPGTEVARETSVYCTGTISFNTNDPQIYSSNFSYSGEGRSSEDAISNAVTDRPFEKLPLLTAIKKGCYGKPSLTAVSHGFCRKKTQIKYTEGRDDVSYGPISSSEYEFSCQYQQ